MLLLRGARPQPPAGSARQPTGQAGRAVPGREGGGGAVGPGHQGPGPARGGAESRGQAGGPGGGDMWGHPEVYAGAVTGIQG